MGHSKSDIQLEGSEFKYNKIIAIREKKSTSVPSCFLVFKLMYFIIWRGHTVASDLKLRTNAEVTTAKQMLPASLSGSPHLFQHHPGQHTQTLA